MTDHIADVNKMVPLRIQRRRTKGWRMPPNTVCVCRPGKWGNPFTVGYDAKTNIDAVSLFSEWLQDAITYAPAGRPAKWLPYLIGRNLACWCRLCPTHAAGKPFAIQCDACEPCHADVLGIAANG